MTLSTNIYILDQVDRGEVFRFCQGMLTKYDDGEGLFRKPDKQTVSDDEFSNIPQGLPAWLTTQGHDSGTRPLHYVWDADACDDDCEEDCDREHSWRRACWMYVNFDTSYGYRDARGWGCGDLHAALIAELGAWLDAKDIRWEWMNEFTGEVWGGEERYEHLSDLGENGAKALDWFITSVVPAIAAGIHIEDAEIIED